MLLVLWFPNNAEALWIGVAFYGLFNGPCVGYCYDLNNRITYVLCGVVWCGVVWCGVMITHASFALPRSRVPSPLPCAIRCVHRHPTEASMSIVMFGLNFGASLVRGLPRSSPVPPCPPRGDTLSPFVALPCPALGPPFSRHRCRT